MQLREALVKEIEEGGHHPATMRQLQRSADDAEEIHARMVTCRLLTEDEPTFHKPTK